VSVLVLQTFAGECRSSGCTADHETARLLIAAGPYEVTDALESEH
jgi:hypothetical protein